MLASILLILALSASADPLGVRSNAFTSTAELEAAGPMMIAGAAIAGSPQRPECPDVRNRNIALTDMCSGSAEPIMIESFDFTQYLRWNNNSCLPRTQEMSSDTSLDACVCRCLQEDASSEGEEFRRIKARNRTSFDLEDRRKQLDLNIERMNRVLYAEVNGMRLQGSTLPTTDENGATLAAIFTNRTTFDVNSRVQQIATEVNSIYERSVGGRPAKGISVPEPDDRLLTSGVPSERQCISYRTVTTRAQMPIADDFYSMMASAPEEFDALAWDYQNLRYRLVGMCNEQASCKGINSLYEFAEARPLIQRLQFLERNPLYKNLFSSTHENSLPFKQDLYRRIRSAYGRPLNTPAERVAAFEALRVSTGRFLSNRELVPMLQNGVNNNLQTILVEAPIRVNRIYGEYNPGRVWSEALFHASRRNGVTYDQNQDPRTTERGNPTVYANYCPVLDNELRKSDRTLLPELEHNFGSLFNPDPGGDFQSLSKALCDTNRRTEDGSRNLNFWGFRDTICSGQIPAEWCTPENRERLLARFLREFPVSQDPESRSEGEIAHLLPFIERGPIIPQIDQPAAAAARRDGTNARRANNLMSDFDGIGRSFSEGNRQVAATNVRESKSQQIVPGGPGQQGSSDAVRTPPFSGGGSADLPILPVVPRVDRPVQPVVTSGEEPARPSEMNGIRDQLARFNQELAGQVARPAAQQDPAQIAALNNQIGALTRRLTEAENANRLLREEQRPATQRTAAEPSSVDDSGPRRGIASVSGGGASGASGGVAPDVQQLRPQGPVPTAVFTAPDLRGTRVMSSQNAALLSKYGVQSGAVQGSLIVATATQGLDYQSLRSQSGESAVPIAVPLDVFNQIAQNNQSALLRYLDQVRAMPGEVIRLTVRPENGSQEQLELFVVKNGTEISIIPGRPVGSSRAIASEPATGRTFTLQQLQDELAQ